MALAEELDALPSDLTQRLLDRGFRRERLLEQAARIGVGRDERNRYPGGVEPPLPTELVDAATPAHPRYAEWRARGEALLREGKVALVVLAGGMATRMGGVVKALVEALPAEGDRAARTFLELRLSERETLSRGATHPMPLWLMTSEATHAPIVSALGARHDGWGIAAFEQCVSLRLTPQGSLFREADGDLSVYATGHGDLPEALAKSGLLARFLEERGDGYLWIANLDNVGASVDAAMLGQFAESEAPCAVEVVDKVGSDKGGVPVRLHGKRIIAEEFRLPKTLDPSSIRVFNTNTFLVRARALHELDFDFTFVEVEKTVGDAKAIQFERLIGEMTVALEPTFLRVPRTGVASRFLPVKDHAELAARRAEIEAVARERGMLAEHRG
jgi:UTP--glucose-1-phosphate uridylyltransferase